MDKNDKITDKNNSTLNKKKEEASAKFKEANVKWKELPEKWKEMTEKLSVKEKRIGIGFIFVLFILLIGGGDSLTTEDILKSCTDFEQSVLQDKLPINDPSFEKRWNDFSNLYKGKNYKDVGYIKMLSRNMYVIKTRDGLTIYDSNSYPINSSSDGVAVNVSGTIKFARVDIPIDPSSKSCDITLEKDVVH